MSNLMNTAVKLEEYIHNKMDILFLALNAPEVSNKNEHWFSRNLSFWNVLFNSGLITQRINDPLLGDELVFKDNKINYKRWIYGVTDLNREVVQTVSNGVKTNSEQVNRIITILEHQKVKKLCIVHRAVALQFEREDLIKRKSGQLDGYGIVGKYKNVPIYEVPFHNASIINKYIYYRLLIEY